MEQGIAGGVQGKGAWLEGLSYKAIIVIGSKNPICFSPPVQTVTTTTGIVFQKINTGCRFEGSGWGVGQWRCFQGAATPHSPDTRADLPEKKKRKSKIKQKCFLLPSCGSAQDAALLQLPIFHLQTSWSSCCQIYCRKVFKLH